MQATVRGDQLACMLVAVPVELQCELQLNDESQPEPKIWRAVAPNPGAIAFQVLGSGCLSLVRAKGDEQLLAIEVSDRLDGEQLLITLGSGYAACAGKRSKPSMLHLMERRWLGAFGHSGNVARERPAC